MTNLWSKYTSKGVPQNLQNLLNEHVSFNEFISYEGLDRAKDFAKSCLERNNVKLNEQTLFTFAMVCGIIHANRELYQTQVVPIIRITGADETDSMLNNMTAFVDTILGRDFGDLNITKLKDLLKDSWYLVFGQRISMTILTAREKLKEGMQKIFSKRFLADFVDLDSRAAHEFEALYAEAINFEISSMRECEFQDSTAIFVDKVVALMAKLGNRNALKDYSKLNCEKKKSIQVFGEYDKAERWSSTTRSAKRQKTGTGSSSEFKSSSYNPLLRQPDIMIQNEDNKIIQFIGEVKPKADQLREAEKQLLALSFPIDQDNSHRLHQSFGLIIAFDLVDLYFFEQKQGSMERYLITSYSLNFIKDRIQLVTNMIILYYVMTKLSSGVVDAGEIAQYRSNYLPVIFRTTCKLQYLRRENQGNFESILKLVDLKQLDTRFGFDSKHIEHLENFYKLIKRDNRNCTIANSLRCADFKHDEKNKTLLAILTPVGLDLESTSVENETDAKSLVRHVLAFLSSIHKIRIAHSDLRSANIIFVENRYLVIDYENIQPFCEIGENNVCQTHKKRFNVNSCISQFTDFMEFSEVLKELKPKSDTVKRVVKIIDGAVVSMGNKSHTNLADALSAEKILKMLD